MKSTAPTDEVCGRIARRLADSVGAWRYQMWFDRATRMNYHDEQRQLNLQVPNRFVADWIGRHFREEIRRAAVTEVGDEVNLHVQISPESFDAVAPAQEAATATAAGEPGMVRRAAAGRPPMGMSLRHRLDQFVVGPSNELAFAAANALVGPEGQGQNPLFIHGGCGLGKTHLLQGICQAMLAMQPAARVAYVTGEHFTNQFLTAVRGNRIDAFRRQMRQLDLLAIDDVHFIADKQATQQEFLHSFDEIELKGARVVLASDSHPKLIQRFSASLISRCVRGMVVEIRPPDADTRIKLVAALAQRRGLLINEAATQLLAARCTGSVREIEGTLARLHALVHLSRRDDADDTLHPIGPSLVNQLFRSEADHRPRRVIRFEHILDIVCRELGVSVAKVIGNARHKDAVLARSIAIYLARQLTSMSCPEIGAAMHRAGHSTIVTAAARVDAQLNQQQMVVPPGAASPVALVELVERLKQAVLRSKPAE